MLSTYARAVAPLGLLLAADVGTQTDNPEFSIAADAPTVSVSPRPAGRNFIRLPSLEYMLVVRPHCGEGRTPGSLTVNIADTRRTVRAEAINIESPTEITLKVPAAQIAPLAVEGFCVTGNGQAAPGELHIAAALVAQASLLCTGEGDQAMVYVSRPLAVSLICERKQRTLSERD